MRFKRNFVPFLLFSHFGFSVLAISLLRWRIILTESCKAIISGLLALGAFPKLLDSCFGPCSAHLVAWR